MTSLEKWEVWWAEVYFEDNPNESKIRPVVVYGGQCFPCVSFKVTSQVKKDKNHIEIVQWESAGLSKPSFIDISRTLSIPEDSFMERIGRLDVEDILSVMRRVG